MAAPINRNDDAAPEVARRHPDWVNDRVAATSTPYGSADSIMRRPGGST
jgi:hypothetical protein